MPRHVPQEEPALPTRCWVPGLRNCELLSFKPLRTWQSVARAEETPRGLALAVTQQQIMLGMFP